MLSTQQAEIVFTSSVALKQAYEYDGIYSATKAAIDMVAETLRIELKDSARVTVVAPGVVDTNFFMNMESSDPTVESTGLGALSHVMLLKLSCMRLHVTVRSSSVTLHCVRYGSYQALEQFFVQIIIQSRTKA